MIRIHQLILGSLSFLISQIGSAAEKIPYKQSLLPQYQWIPYGLTLLILILFTIYTAKKRGPNFNRKTECHLIEKHCLSNKTTLYLLEYQDQRFLLADNLQAITLKFLNSKDQHA